MPTLVQFGAGNIGRGFIAPLFSAAGWRVVFVEVAPALVAALRTRGRYRVWEVDNAGERAVEVGPVEVVDGRDLAAVTAALATCDLAATAVGLAVLPRLAAAIAVGAAARAAAHCPPLDVLVCENGARPAALLREAVAVATAAPGVRIGAVRAAIGRMIPAPGPGADLLDLRAEPYRHLPVERAAFLGPIPAVPDVEAVDDIDLELRSKLYLHNLTHACLAYAGHLAGHATIPACMDDPELVEGVRAAGEEAVEALARAHGRTPARARAVRASASARLDDLLARYRNRALNDPVARVARDPWRKLAADDRLLGALRLCLEHGVEPAAIAHHVLCACRYHPDPDEPQAARFCALRDQGPDALLAAVSGLGVDEPPLAYLRALRYAPADRHVNVA